MKKKSSLDLTTHNQDLKENISEGSIIRAIIFSNSIIIIASILLYFIYNLFYDYLTIVIFAIISSIALRKTKDNFVSKIFEFIYSEKTTHYQNSFAHLLFNYVWKFLINIKNLEILTFLSMIFKFPLTFTNDIYIVTIIFLGYFLIIVFPLTITLAIIILILILDLIIRISLDVINCIKISIDCSDKKKNRNVEKHKIKKFSHEIYLFFFRDRENVKNMINTFVTMILIFLFFFLLLILFVLLISLCSRDIKLLIDNSKSIFHNGLNKINMIFLTENTNFENGASDLPNYFEEILGAFLKRKELQTAVAAFKSIIFFL